MKARETEKREKERGSYKESVFLWVTQGSRDKLHLNSIIFASACWLYANTPRWYVF